MAGAGLSATFVDADTFTVAGDLTTTFVVGRRIKADCGVDGYKFGTITSSSFGGGVTTVNLTAASDDLTSNLDVVWYGIVGGGADDQSIPIHSHDGSEGSGGEVTPVFGSEYDYDSSDGQSDTSSSTPQQKLRLTTSSLPSGTYHIEWGYEFNVDSNKDSDFNAQVQINDTTTIAEQGDDQSWKTETVWIAQSGFYDAVLSGVLNIDIDYWDSASNGVSIRRARIAIWRVA